ncbi:MAG: Holliday junction resolvase RecU [Lachnospiraceae bacterium]|nr:Holliday junction resolvase RecU [Lachnospiraceae bacterium]
MGEWNSRGLRGSAFEELINLTIERYRELGLALIQKVPTPITPIQIDQATRHITLAYFEKKSTVDYIGVVQGIPVCFDAKECAEDTFSLQNVHEHQFAFMEEFEKQEGVAFLLIYYTAKEQYYYLRFSKLKEFYERMQKGGRKSFRLEETEEAFFLPKGKGVPVPFLEAMQIDLNYRE